MGDLARRAGVAQPLGAFRRRHAATVVPVAEMAAMAHRHGAVVVVDGAQAVSHFPVDVTAIDADFYAFSGRRKTRFGQESRPTANS